MQPTVMVALATALAATLAAQVKAAPVRADRCVDDDAAFLALLASRGHGGKLTGCSDPFVQPRCSVGRIRQLCCASCSSANPNPGPGPTPLEAQTKPTCDDNVSKLQDLLDSFMPGAVVPDRGCSDPRIKQNCHVDSIKDACCATCLAPWTHMYVPYADPSLVIEPYEEDDVTYLRDDKNRQHLHIRQAEGCPARGCPVHLYAHGNGADASALGDVPAASVTDAGYTLISWESVTPVIDQDDSDVCVDDASLVFQWAKANAVEYNLDTSRFVIGGRSRGSGCSWPLAHSNDPAIAGIYMFSALPDPAWLSSDGSPVDVVTVSSPLAWLGYPADCGGDGPTLECPGNDPADDENDHYDIHSPANGVKIANAYADHGIADKIEVVDGLQTGAPGDPININANFAGFVASLPATLP